MIRLHGYSKPVYKYACHEGYHSLAGILVGARAEESKTPTAK